MVANVALFLNKINPYTDNGATLLDNWPLRFCSTSEDGASAPISRHQFMCGGHWCSGRSSTSYQCTGFKSHDEWVLLLVFFHINSASTGWVSRKQTSGVINISWQLVCNQFIRVYNVYRNNKTPYRPTRLMHLQVVKPFLQICNRRRSEQLGQYIEIRFNEGTMIEWKLRQVWRRVECYIIFKSRLLQRRQMYEESVFLFYNIRHRDIFEIVLYN